MRGVVLAFIAISLRGLYPIVGKVLIETISPFLILLLNQATAGIILILLLDLFRKLKKLKTILKKDFRFILAVSIVTAFGGPILFLLGLSISSATNSILVGRAEPVLASLFGVLIMKEKVTKHQIIGAFVILFGLLLIVTETFSLGFHINPGDLLVFLSAVLFASGTVLYKKKLQHIQPEIIVTLRNLFGACIVFLFLLFLVDFSAVATALSMKFIVSLLLLVFFVTILGQYLWYKALEKTSATNVSLIGLASPIIATFFAVVFLGEYLTKSQIAGGIIIVIGLIIMEFHLRKIHTHKTLKHHLGIKHWPH